MSETFMGKSEIWIVSFYIILITLVDYGTCQEDWSLGCFKQNTSFSASCFDVTAGDYDPLVNMTGEACVSACSALDINNKLAGLTASGACMCSQSDDNCLQNASNVSCLYPQSDGWYYKVYRVAQLPTLNAKSSVSTFDLFNVSIASADSSCTYTLDFDDGVKKTFQMKESGSVSHYYPSAGEYKISLSAHPRCLPRDVTHTIRSNNKKFANASLTCPEIIELTAKESCMLSVLQGSDLHVTNLNNGGKFENATLPDTVVETIASPSMEESDIIQALSNGTYVIPTLSAANDGILIGLQFGIVSNNTITIQILSPKCQGDWTACRGGCVQQSCTAPNRTDDEMLSENCATSNVKVTTESNNNTKYNVSKEFTISTTEEYKDNRLKLSEPISIKRGDVIAFHASTDATAAKLLAGNGSYVLAYCGQTFKEGDEVLVSNGRKWLRTMFWIRLHLAVSQILEIPIVPKIPNVPFAFNISASGGNKNTLEEVVDVEERIGGLEIHGPLRGVHYATDKNVSFSFNVSNGTSVTYSLDPGDKTVLLNTTSDRLNHSYSKRGEYTFTVTARNRINSVSSSQNVSVAVDVKTLKFDPDPSEDAHEVNKTFNISFSLEAGDEPTFYVEFGNNVSVFMLCQEKLDNKKEMDVSVTYSTVGNYTISVTAFSSLVNNNKLTIYSTVEIMSRIQNLTVSLDGSPMNGSLIENHPPGTPMKLQASVSSGWPVQYTFYTKYRDGKKTKVHDSSCNYTFNPPQGGLWTIIVEARNRLRDSNETFTVEVDVINGCESTMEIYDRRKKVNPFITNSANDIRFNTEEKFYSRNCSSLGYNCWTFNWTLYNESDKQVPDFSQDKKHFFIGKGKIKPGKYQAKLHAMCNETNRTNAESKDETYFTVEALKPVAIILGGIRRDVPQGWITLDASTSYNPNVGLFNSSYLSFNWTRNDSSVTLLNWKTPKVEINATMFNSGKTFEVTVTVNDTKYGKTANATQVVRIVDSEAPTTEIVCRVNCLPLVNPADRLSLEGKCDSCGGAEDNVIFKWTLQDKSGEKILLDDSFSNERTLTGFSKENLVFLPNALNRSEQYRLELFVKRNKFTSRSYYEFDTAGTLGGKCQMSEKNGTALETDFRVKCDVTGGEPPLFYTIRYNSSVQVLWYHGQESVSPSSQLPAGQANDYMIPITVEVQGRYGSYLKNKLSVTVVPPKDGLKNLEKTIKNLDNLNNEHDSELLIPKVIAIAQVVNDGDKNGESTAETSEELRRSLMEKVSEPKATTLPEIEQISDAIKVIASNNTQVTHQTQESAVKTLDNLSETFRKIADDPGTKTGKQIDETAQALLSAVSSIIGASLYTGQETSKSNAPEEVKPNLYGTLSREGANLKKIGDETKDIVESLDKAIELVTASLAKHKLFGERPTVKTTPEFEVTLTKTGKDWNETDGRINLYEKKISFPSDELEFLNENRSDVFAEAITFKNNPYTWDVKHSHYIQPNVFSFNFRDKNGKKIPIKNLNDDIEINLQNQEDSIVYNRLNNSADDKEFLLYNFLIDEYHYEETIMIDLKKRKNSNHGQAVLYVKFGEEASEGNYDFKQWLSEDCRNCSDFPMDIRHHKGSFIVIIRAAKKLKAAEGKVSVGLSPRGNDAENSSTLGEPEKHDYEIYVQTVSCRHWNYSEWIKDGCRVGYKSTPQQTSCLCNHLTAFSSYIVKPNPLTKFSLEDFRQGYVCFVAVTVVFIFYFLLLLWARRADREDSCKVGVCGLADNRPGDRYRYEIAIWTGMRRNAGTRSEVNIILSGDKNDSDPRCLANPQNPGFGRASLEKFLLTTPKEIGSLYCIRVWHDNSRGSWYLSRVMVTDLQKDERYYFICDRWLAVDEDDGQVERLLPVASDEELADFHHLFYSKTKRGLSDTHLWVSVINRPPQSTFTRIQRLSCCLCILMTTMMANAMFYQRKSEPKANSTNFIGSYSFTWDQVFIGVVSSLIIVPVNLVILNIFRNVRPKSRKSRSQSKASLDNLDSGYYNIRNSRTSSEFMETFSQKETKESIGASAGNVYTRLRSGELKKKRDEKLSRLARLKRTIIPSSLPHWFVYVGWVILVLVTLGSAAVVILYGMEFGNGRSMQWLLSIAISIMEDIFVLQPLKVLLFALGFALLVKKPDEGEFEMSEDYDDDAIEMGIISESHDNIAEKKATTSPRIPIRPSEEQLAVMRRARMKERKMFFLIQEITVHLIFMIVIALVTYGHKDSRAVHLYRQMDSLSAKTDELYSFKQFWNWSQVVLTPKVFPETLYNGEYVPSYGFLDDGSNNLISRARMRLLRVKNDSCNVPEEFKGEIDCLEDYSILNEDIRCYREGWKMKGRRGKPWCFQNWRDLDGYPTWGIFDTYSGNGYINELTPGSNNSQTMSKLQSLNWLDEQSRAVFVEMTTYNANVNLYASVRLLFEFPEFGGIFYFKSIIPMRLKLYVGGFAFFIFACEMAYLLFILGYTYVALKKFYRQRMAYFKDFWNSIDFAILMTSYAAVGVYVYRIGLTTELMKKVSDRDGGFVNFQYVTYWNEVLNWIMALVVALTTVKLIKLMRFNLRVSLFGKTLQDAKPALAGFSLQFGIVVFAYIMMGVLIFGRNVYNFKSIPSAMMTLGRVILGKSQFNDLFLADRVIGPIFLFTYVMFVSWILMSMFVAILTDSYHDVQDRCFGMRNEYEIVDFFIARFRSWSGFGGKKKKIPANKRWLQAGVKARAAATLGRQRSYKPSEENIAFEKTGDLMERFEDSIKALEKRVQHLSVHFQ